MKLPHGTTVLRGVLFREIIDAVSEPWVFLPFGKRSTNKTRHFGLLPKGVGEDLITTLHGFIPFYFLGKCIFFSIFYYKIYHNLKKILRKIQMSYLQIHYNLHSFRKCSSHYLGSNQRSKCFARLMRSIDNWLHSNKRNPLGKKNFYSWFHEHNFVNKFRCCQH